MSDVITGEDGVRRCAWGAADPLYRAYHDDEWGRPLHGDDALFELLTLEGFQAGLAWITILRKREAFRAPSAASRSSGWPGTTRATSSDCSVTPGSSVTAGRSRRRSETRAPPWRFPAASTPWSGRMRPKRGRSGSRDARRGAGLDRRVARAVEGAEAPRLSVRRADDRLRVHAVGRPGRRSSGGLRRRGRRAQAFCGSATALVTADR